MKYRELVESAQKVDAFNVCVARSSLYHDIGLKDPYEQEFPDGGEESTFVDVRSAREQSLFGYALDACRRRYAGRLFEFRVSSLFEGMPNGDGEVREAREEFHRRMAAHPNLQGFSFGFVREYLVQGVVIYKISFFAQNRCWARYVLAKELSHIITNTVRDGEFHDATALLSEAENWQRHISGPDDEMTDEAVGVYHAMEVLLPWRLRKGGGVVRRDGDSLSLQHIARRFMIPMQVLNHFFEESGYGKILFGPKTVLYSAFSYGVNADVELAEKDRKIQELRERIDKAHSVGACGRD